MRTLKIYKVKAIGLVLVTVLVAGFMGLGFGSGAQADTLTPQQTVSLKVYYNLPLTPTDAYVFFLMVRAVAPATDIPDAKINQAITDYNNGDPSSLTMLPTAQEESGDIAQSAGASAIPVCGNPGYVWGFTIKIKNVVGATLFSNGYNIWWNSFCGAVVKVASGPNFTHDTTNLGGITGWSYKDLTPNEKYYFTWNGYTNGGYHNKWTANWERCIPIPLVGTYCLGDYHVNEHVDIFADGVGCLEGTGQGTRRCWYAAH